MTQTTESGDEPPENEIWWPSIAVVRSVHRRVMEREGRQPEYCRESLLESALARGLNRFRYGNSGDVITQGAWLSVDLARSHSFTDGNKRTALTVLALYLDQNGWLLQQRAKVEIAVHLLAAIEQFQMSAAAGEVAVTKMEGRIRKSIIKK